MLCRSLREILHDETQGCQNAQLTAVLPSESIAEGLIFASGISNQH